MRTTIDRKDRAIRVRVNEETYERLKKVSKEERKTVSEIIREGIEDRCQKDITGSK